MRKRKILLVAGEVYPFAKTGGVADTVAGLALALRAHGHEVRVMLPKYGFISERKNKIHEINRLREIPIDFAGKSDYVTIKSATLSNPKAKVQVYLTTHNQYFESRWGIYNDPETGEPYPDNNQRFLFFTLSVIQMCKTLNWYPDIVHCNDWPTGFFPVYARVLFKEEFKKAGIVYTIHNIHIQGEFPIKETLSLLDIPAEIREYLIHRKKVNFLKSGISFADILTTVSPTYRKMLLSDSKLTKGLNTLLQQKEQHFYPILNGIDTMVWNPRKDRWIAKNYDVNSIERKEANKKALLEKAHLRYSPSIPVIGMISRLVPEKGLDLFQKAADELIKLDCQFVILGSGEKEYEEFLRAFAQKYPDKVGVRIGFDEVLAHLITAGADIYLMPSYFEPCGLNQLYAMAYGTVPVVRATGGLIDTVKDFDPKTQKGTGIVFTEYTTKALKAALQRAIQLFHNKDLWYTLIRNCMKEDNSWERRVKEYEKVYAAAQPS